MKFREWMDKINAQRIDISEVSESLYADGHSITVTIQPRGSIAAEIDGRQTDIRYLRSFFTHHKEDFAAMLESITERCALLKGAAEMMVNVAAYDAIPGAVIDRLKGKDTDDLIKKSVEARLCDLIEVVLKIEHVFHELDFEFPSFGDYAFRLEKSTAGMIVRWGGSTIWNNGHVSYSNNLQEQIMFLGNFAVAKERLERFVEIVLQLDEIGR